MKTSLFLLLALTACCRADDVVINIEGYITATTCSVDSASQNLTVDLGQAASGDFKDIGDTGNWRDFEVTLSQCPSTVTLATATFKGQADSAHPTKFANTGTAGGLALELADRQDKILIAPQASFSMLVNQSDHTVDFPLSARYYATSMPVTAGTFNSVVQVTFTYQ